MNRIHRIYQIGLAIVLLGFILCLCGTSTSSQWQTLGDDSVDSGFGISLRGLGNLTLLAGFTVLAGGAWSWLNAKEEEVAKQRLLESEQSELLAHQ
jgi:hypothetical protein